MSSLGEDGTEWSGFDCDVEQGSLLVACEHKFSTNCMYWQQMCPEN